MPNAPLLTIGHIEIPSAVLDHRFVAEALVNAQLRDKYVQERVVGTANTGKCELYGWAPNVDDHTDGFGYVYLTCLNAGLTSICVCAGDRIHEVFAPAGTVIRLDDRLPHWTTDSAVRVAAFVGSFADPCDEVALATLQSGITSLAADEYYGAPRVRDGFRVLLEDECWAVDSLLETLDTMLIADATRAGNRIETCARCDRPATRPDPAWPIRTARSRCSSHLTQT